MVEPDQHPEPVVGEQSQEDLEAPGAEVLRRQGPALQRRDAGAHRAVLIVPSGVRGHAQERVDDRRHPQAPAQDADRLLDQADHALGAEQHADRAGAALQKGSEEHQVDAEQGCRQRPVDHARQGLVVEQAHAALGGTETQRPVFAEQRVDDVIGCRAMDGRVGGELGGDRGDLGSVEVPGHGSGGDAAQERAQRIDPPDLQVLALPRPHGAQVADEIDAGIGQRADGCPE